MKNIQNLTIDINKKPFQTITANVGEVASRFIRITILENNIPADLTGVTAYLYAKKADGTKVFNSVTVENAKQGIVLAELTSQVLAIAGLVRLTLLLTKDGAKLASKQIIVTVDESAIDEEAIQSTNEFNALTDALVKVNNIDNNFDKMQNQIDNLVLESGGDSNLEVVQARVGDDGKIYETLREAIIDQTKLLPVNLTYNKYNGRYFNAISNGFGESADHQTSDFIKIPQGVKTLYLKDYDKNKYVYNVAFLSSESADSFISGVCYGVTPMPGEKIVIPTNANYVTIGQTKTSNTKLYYDKNEIEHHLLIESLRKEEFNNKFNKVENLIINRKITPHDTTFIKEYNFNLASLGEWGNIGFWYNGNGVLTQNPYVSNSIKPLGLIPCKPNTTYITNKATWGIIGFNDKNEKVWWHEENLKEKTFITPNDCYFIGINFRDDSQKFDEDYINTVKVIEGDNTNGEHIIKIDGLVVDTQTDNQKETVTTHIPNVIYAIEGDTLELFYDGIFNVANIDNYIVVVTNPIKSIGNAYRHQWVFTPSQSDVGKTYPLTFTLYNNLNNKICEVTTNIIVKTKPVINKTLNVLCVGDSLTQNGEWVNELYRRLTSTDGNPVGSGYFDKFNFVGTQCSYINKNVKYEGRGGWTFGSYNTKGEEMYWITIDGSMKDQSMHQSVWEDLNKNKWAIETFDIDNNRIKMKRNNKNGTYTMPTQGILTYVSGSSTDTSDIIFNSSKIASGNPLFNENTNTIDFKNYCNLVNASSIDYCLVLLGWNSILGGNSSIENCKIFIDNLHKDYPNCKIIISGLQMPSVDGWGANYGSMVKNAWQQDIITLNNKVVELGINYENLCLQENYNLFTKFSHLTSQFDKKYGYPESEVQVNIRRNTKIKRQNNCVHPNTSGSYQISDAFYRILLGWI